MVFFLWLLFHASLDVVAILLDLCPLFCFALEKLLSPAEMSAEQWLCVWMKGCIILCSTVWRAVRHKAQEIEQPCSMISECSQVSACNHSCYDIEKYLKRKEQTPKVDQGSENILEVKGSPLLFHTHTKGSIVTNQHFICLASFSLCSLVFPNLSGQWRMKLKTSPWTNSSHWHCANTWTGGQPLKRTWKGIMVA